ncbi:MAG: hypothetical protein MRJ92_12115 [Nitrospira sp.]|nr:hypothetical protein [Nitrospira sp.]
MEPFTISPSGEWRATVVVGCCSPWTEMRHDSLIQIRPEILSSAFRFHPSITSASQQLQV